MHVLTKKKKKKPEVIWLNKLIKKYRELYGSYYAMGETKHKSYCKLIAHTVDLRNGKKYILKVLLLPLPFFLKLS